MLITNLNVKPMKKHGKLKILMLLLSTMGVGMSSVVSTAGVLTENAVVPRTPVVNQVQEFTDGMFNYRTFRIQNSQEGDYFPSFWIIPARHGDGTFTRFNVSVNGKEIGAITPEKENWQCASLDGDSPIPLTVGENVITVSTPCPEIPEVEILELSESLTETPQCQEEYDQYLQYAKEQSEEALAFSDFLETDRMDVTENSGVFSATLDLSYSFHKKFELTKGESFKVTSSSSVPHVIDILYCGEYKALGIDPITPVYPPVIINGGDRSSMPKLLPSDSLTVTDGPRELVLASAEEMQGLNWAAPSEKKGVTNIATAKIHRVPKTGCYLLRLRSEKNNIVATADLNVNDKYSYSDCPISCSYLSLILPANTKYWIYTESANSGVDDPMLFVHGNDADRVVAWNDDKGTGYVLGEKKYPESRLNQSFLVRTSGISVSSSSSIKPRSKCEVNISKLSGAKSVAERERPASESENNECGLSAMMDGNSAALTISRSGSELKVSSDVVMREISIYDFSGTLLSRIRSNSMSETISMNVKEIDSRNLCILNVVLESGEVISKKVVF